MAPSAPSVSDALMEEERREITVGFWGRHTSTIDWCEYNYEVTPYIAEFWNTVTNLWMILPPLYGILNSYRHNYERRFIVSYFALLVIGVGSWLFHMTLRYDMQLLDEVPMVFGSAGLTYCIYQVRQPVGERNVLLAALLLVYCCLFVVIYLVIDKPIFQEVIYGILVFIMMVLDLDLTIKQSSRFNTWLFAFGLSMYLLGFGLWNLELIYCSSLRQLRASGTLPPALNPLTQLHAWWHVLAGYATYLQITSVIHHRQRFLGRPCTYTYSWLVGLTVVSDDDDGEKRAKKE